MTDRLLSAGQRVCEASREAYELAIDAIYDSEIQTALFQRSRLQAESALIREEKIVAIRDRARPAREEFLIGMLGTSNDTAIRNAAAIALADLDAGSAVATIQRLLRDPMTENSRGALLHALSLIKVTFELATIVAMLLDDNEEVQFEALIALEQNRYTHGGKADLKHCLVMLERANQKRYCRYVTHAIDILSKACAACHLTDKVSKGCVRCRTSLTD